MIYPIKLYLKDRWIWPSFFVSTLFFLAVFWYTFSRIKPTNDQLFLHFNIIFGVDLIGEWWKLYYIPVISFVIIILNFILSYLFHRTNRFVSRFLAITAVGLELMLLVATNLIVGLNS